MPLAFLVERIGVACLADLWRIELQRALHASLSACIPMRRWRTQSGHRPSRVGNKGRRASVHPQFCVLARSFPLRRWRTKSGRDVAPTCQRRHALSDCGFQHFPDKMHRKMGAHPFFDLFNFDQLFPWRNVYPLVTPEQCQGKTQAFAFGWSDRFMNSSCKCADRMTGPLRRCSESSCATMLHETQTRPRGHWKARVQNRQTSRLGSECNKGLRPSLIIMQRVMLIARLPRRVKVAECRL